MPARPYPGGFPRLLAGLAGLAITASALHADNLLTVAEGSDYRATATHAEAMDLIGRIDAASDLVHVTEIGRTNEGRAIPLLVIADPPVTTAVEARATGKPLVFAFGDIHAGEVCGKEALLMLARELATTPDHPLLRDLVVLLAPIYNGDGNDRMAVDNRRGQVGPELGMGERANTQGLDLNRDWVKLESPEARAMVRFLTEWDPDLTIDTHTTNGSHHRYTLTYAAPLNPLGHAPSIAFVRDELLPEVTTRLRARTGYDTFFYGNLNRDQTVWATYSADPRFGGPYRGLRGQMSILSEAYAYAPYRDRVLATLEFVREIMTYATENASRIRDLHERARAETTANGAAPQPDDCVGIRHRLAALPRPATIRGWVMTPPEAGRRPRPTDEPMDHRVVHLGRFEPTVCVQRPYAYLVAPGLDGVVEKLRQHGIEVEPFEGPARVEAYTVTDVRRPDRAFQGHRMLTLEVEATSRRESFGAGTTIVRTAQPLGTLAVYLLEPRSTDGLAAWNLMDDLIAGGAEFPVYRVRRKDDLARP
jgi:hypothetical protein